MDMRQALAREELSFGTPLGRGRGTSVSPTSMLESLRGARNANPLEAARAYLNDPDPEGYQRANVLPYATTADGGIEWAVPAMGREIMREGLAGIEAPKRVLDGEISPEQGAFDAALAVFGMGSVGGWAVPNAVPKGALTANVWQGGPHKYGPEGAAKSLDHIGEGEGATAYGWGRYDAGARDVGEQYRVKLSTDGGKVIAGEQDFSFSPNGGKGEINDLLKRVYKEVSLSSTDSHGKYKTLGEFSDEVVDDALSGMRASPETINWATANLKGKDIGFQPGGNLYKHDLPDEDIARYMDWDKPLSNQPESVRAALEQFGYKADPEGLRNYDNALLDALDNNPNRTLPDLPADPTGEKIYQSLVDKNGALDWPVGSDLAAREAYRGSAKQAASEALRKSGIPGMQYYDGISRYADGGANAKGTAMRILDAAGGDYDKAVDIAKARRAAGNMDPNDPRSNLSRAIDMLENKFDDGRTRNYVTWDQDVLDRMKLLERNGETFGMGGSPIAAAPLAVEQKPTITPEMMDALLYSTGGA
jgi:hypothetical protein